MILAKNDCKPWFVVEGNIGSGKSTFLKIVQQRLGIPVLAEPVHLWQAIEGKYNLLEKFYENMPRWAYTFQSYAFVSRIREHERHMAELSASVTLIERSVFSDRHCFAKNCFEAGNMSLLEWRLYQEWFSWLVKSFQFVPNGFIYLQTDPEVCFSRLQERNRSEEASVSVDYLKQLHDKHEDWLIEKQGIDPVIAQVPVLVLSCNADFEYDMAQQWVHLNQVESFIAGIHTNFRPKMVENILIG